MHPILYSFRRCPYAMRARLALLQAGITCEIREIALKDKPAQMLAISPKGTVPVLHIQPHGNSNEFVIDQSIEIMLWALKKNDSDTWLSPNQGNLKQMLELIKHNDNDFKYHLDRYKYPNRFEPTEDSQKHRKQACLFLKILESRLQTSNHLFGTQESLADIAIFPFIRQFAAVDQDWFEQAPFPTLKDWLNHWLEDTRFQKTMTKSPVWQTNDEPTLWFTPPSPESYD
ncbi:MAG: glutathione S-transferase [Mariprofundaceae bacterium]